MLKLPLKISDIPKKKYFKKKIKNRSRTVVFQHLLEVYLNTNFIIFFKNDIKTFFK